MKIKKLTAKEYLLYAGIILIGVLLDQGTKHLVARFMELGESVTLIPGVLHLTYETNRGAAFSMLADSRWVFISVSFIMLAVLIPYLFLGLTDSKLSAVSVAMIISGGVGNMIDRLSARAAVIDFIDFSPYFPAIFNGADSFVCVGSGLLVFGILREMKAEKNAALAKKAADETADEKGVKEEENPQ